MTNWRVEKAENVGLDSREDIHNTAFQQDGRQMYSRIHVDWHILLHGASTLYEAKVLSLADFTRNLS